MDNLWKQIKIEAEEAVRNDIFLRPSFENAILKFENFGAALAHRLAGKLVFDDLGWAQIESIAREAFQTEDKILERASQDIIATVDRDPSCNRYLEPFMFFKGFQALQVHRLTHFYWKNGRHDLARLLQMRNSEVFTFDSHPAALIGGGVMFDHAHSIVIGETAVVEDNVSILHSVTLGGTGKDDGDRHPKIGSGVMIGAGAKVLGNVKVGHCSRIAAGSVVLDDIPANSTVAGIPARIVGEAGCADPAGSMDQFFVK